MAGTSTKLDDQTTRDDVQIPPGWLKRQLDSAAERAAKLPDWLTRSSAEKTPQNPPAS